MAYSAPTAHCAVSSETLMLQVRFAHPPNPAPLSRFFVLFRSAYFPSPHRIGFSSCSGVPHGLFFDSAPNRLFKPLRCSGRLIRQAETLDLQPLRGLHRSTLCFFFQNAHASGSLRSPSVSAPKPSFRRFRCSAWLIQLRQRTALSPLKRSCFSRFAHPPNPAPSSRLFSISRRSGLMAPLCKGSCPASSRTEGLPPG